MLTAISHHFELRLPSFKLCVDFGSRFDLLFECFNVTLEKAFINMSCSSGVWWSVAQKIGFRIGALYCLRLLFFESLKASPYNLKSMLCISSGFASQSGDIQCGDS